MSEQFLLMLFASVMDPVVRRLGWLLGVPSYPLYPIHSVASRV